MSEDNNNIDVLKNYIGAPTSLEAERIGHRYFLDSQGSTVPDEANLLSLMTLEKFFDGEKNDVALIKKVGKEESRYFMEAIKLLQGEEDDMPGGNKAETFQTAKKLRQKFGSGFKSAMQLSQMLKTKAEQVEFDKMMEPLVSELSTTVLKNFV